MSRSSFSVNPHSIVCLNVKELLAQTRQHIWSLGDSNEIGTYNHLVRKQTLNNLVILAKWLSCVASTYLYSAFDCMLFSCHLMSCNVMSCNPMSRNVISCQAIYVIIMSCYVIIMPPKLQIWRLLRAKSLLTFRQTIEGRFILKLLRDMIVTYSQMHRTAQSYGPFG